MVDDMHANRHAIKLAIEGLNAFLSTTLLESITYGIGYSPDYTKRVQQLLNGISSQEKAREVTRCSIEDLSSSVRRLATLP